MALICSSVYVSRTLFAMMFLSISHCEHAVKSIIISPLNIEQTHDSYDIVLKQDSVKMNNELINITVESQSDFDIAINLSNEWSFHPSKPSSILLQINSDQPINNAISIIISFSVSSKYFSIILSMDNTTGPSLIYPQCDTHLSSGNILDAMKNSTNRRQTIANGQISDPISFHNEWPLMLQITNYPEDNLMIFKEKERECKFNEAMSTQNGMSIVIAGDQNGQSFSITNLSIDYYEIDGDNDGSFRQRYKKMIVLIALSLGIICPLICCVLCCLRIWSKQLDKEYETKRQNAKRKQINKRMPKWSMNSVTSIFTSRPFSPHSTQTYASPSTQMVITPSIAEKRFIEKNGNQNENDMAVVTHFDTFSLGTTST